MYIYIYHPYEFHSSCLTYTIHPVNLPDLFVVSARCQAETLPFRKSAIGVSLAKSLHEAVVRGEVLVGALDSMEMYM